MKSWEIHNLNLAKRKAEKEEEERKKRKEQAEKYPIRELWQRFISGEDLTIKKDEESE